jgi:hypothetical protein
MCYHTGRGGYQVREGAGRRVVPQELALLVDAALSFDVWLPCVNLATALACSPNLQQGGEFEYKTLTCRAQSSDSLVACSSV